MGSSGAGAGGQTAEPTDASGLLDASADPWDGEEIPGGDEVGSELGTAAGGEGLGTAGMPYLPGMGGTGASGAGRDGTNERTDASGLLEPSTEPWTGDDEAGDDEAGSVTGALPGVPFLPGFGTAAPGTTGATTRRADTRGGERTGEAAPAEEGTTHQDSAEHGASTAEAPVAVGSDGMPLPAPETAVAPQPAADDGEEDFSAWEAGAGAFVPLLWAVRGDHEGRRGTVRRRRASPLNRAVRGSRTAPASGRWPEWAPAPWVRRSAATAAPSRTSPRSPTSPTSPRRSRRPGASRTSWSSRRAPGAPHPATPPPPSDRPTRPPDTA
ncbi:hypothetical protein N7U49_01375 [Streptomyces sp. AD2-2]|nr:hypothetical protein N7U49_01375 [Streptomyces sp. AD2-2]